ncbi:MAG: hypothetical protein ABI728_04240, partial [Betaproteobacteria bacterium]
MTRTLRHERMDYLVADADLLPQDLGWWAVLRTRAVDELTGAPPLNRVTLTTTTRGCLPRVAENGLCGLIARPRDVSGQMLTAGAFTAELRADGYLPRSLTAAIDAARRAAASAAAGATQLSIAPPEPAPPATRRQFVAGRGVLLETRTPNTPHEFSVVAEPAIAPAPGIVPLSDPVQAPRPAAGAPWQVAGVPLVLSDQPLHRAEPAILRASARLQSTAGALPIPAPAAEVGLTGVWWTFAEIPANSSPPHPPDLVSLRAPLAFDHPAAILERLASRTPGGVARALAATAFAGASQIELSNVSGLLVGG